MPEDANTQTTLALLRSSVARLRRIVEPLDDASVDQPAFPAEWSIAQVLSHLGSGAEIMQRGLDDTVNGRETPESFAPSVWDAWNAKSSRAQVDDALAADAALLARLEAVATSGAAELEFPMGPLTMDFATFVGMRVNEHTMHTWDVEVALAPEVPLPADAVPFVVDHLELIARYTVARRATSGSCGSRPRIRPGASWSSWPPTRWPSRPGARGPPTSRSPPRRGPGSSTAGSMPTTPRRPCATPRPRSSCCDAYTRARDVTRMGNGASAEPQLLGVASPSARASAIAQP